MKDLKQLPKSDVPQSGIDFKLTPELVTQWLGEKEMEVKVRDRVIASLQEEIKRLQSLISSKQD